MGKGSEQTFPQEDRQQAHEKAVTPLITRETPTTGTVRGHHTPVRTATGQEATSAGEDTETASSRTAGGCKLLRPLGNCNARTTTRPSESTAGSLPGGNQSTTWAGAKAAPPVH